MQEPFAVATRQTAPVGADGEKPQGRGFPTLVAEGSADREPTLKRDAIGSWHLPIQRNATDGAVGAKNLKRGV